MKVCIVGGGINGLCTAWYLQKAGVSVIIVDKGNFKDGTSFGNAGMVVPSHFVPLASPGVIKKGIKWMFNSKSPFYIKPKADLELAIWLWKFYQSCTIKNVENNAQVLYEFNLLSKSLYEEMAKELDFSFEKKGLLMVYKTLKQEKEEIELAKHAHKLGINAEILNNVDLSRLEPKIPINCKGALYFPDDAHFNPGKLMKLLVTELKEKDVQFLDEKEVLGFRKENNKIVSAQLKGNQEVEANNFIITAGSWSGILLKKLGINTPLQAGKGYSFTILSPNKKPTIPAILSEAKATITPMGNDVRIAGTLEINGFSNQINNSRLKGITEAIHNYYPDLNYNFQNSPIWQGYRPCSPDGIPYIGKTREFSNLFVATGHGMMGISLGAATGKIMAELALNHNSSMPLNNFNVERFI